MGQSISAFRGAYDFLSNFYPALITYNGLVFKNNEAAFQAAKCPERSSQTRNSPLYTIVRLDIDTT